MKLLSNNILQHFLKFINYSRVANGFNEYFLRKSNLNFRYMYSYDVTRDCKSERKLVIYDRVGILLTFPHCKVT